MVDRIGANYLLRVLNIQQNPLKRTCPKMCHLSVGTEFINYKGNLDPESPYSPTKDDINLIKQDGPSSNLDSLNSSIDHSEFKVKFTRFPGNPNTDKKSTPRTPGQRKSDPNISTNNLLLPTHKGENEYVKSRLYTMSKAIGAPNLLDPILDSQFSASSDLLASLTEKITYKNFPRLKQAQMSNLAKLELPDIRAKKGNACKTGLGSGTVLDFSLQLVRMKGVSPMTMPNSPRTQKIYFNNLITLDNVTLYRKAKPIKLSKPRDPKMKYTIILDIDETLVFVPKSTRVFYHRGTTIAEPRTTKTQMLFVPRPNLRYFLTSLFRIFEVILYTSGEKSYADDISKSLGVDERKFAAICSRNQCHILQDGRVLKDLNVIPNREIKEMFIVDDSPEVWKLFKEQLFTISPYQGEKRDRGLLDAFEDIMEVLYPEDLNQY